MSAETLRRAAALMRERAGCATQGRWTHDGGWTVTAPPPSEDWIGPYIVLSADHARNDGEHAAAWHPATALAVADWLDLTARNWGEHPGHERHALVVARTYLGEQP